MSLSRAKTCCTCSSCPVRPSASGSTFHHTSQVNSTCNGWFGPCSKQVHRYVYVVVIGVSELPGTHPCHPCFQESGLALCILFGLWLTLRISRRACSTIPRCMLHMSTRMGPTYIRPAQDLCCRRSQDCLLSLSKGSSTPTPVSGSWLGLTAAAGGSSSRKWCRAPGLDNCMQQTSTEIARVQHSGQDSSRS